MASNMTRTLKVFRDDGYLCHIAEKFNPHVGEHGIRQDAFGIIDLIAIRPETPIAGIQVCGQDFAPHLKKIATTGKESALTWLLAGGSLQLWGWRKLKVKRGGKATRWTPRIKIFTLEDFGIGGMFA